MTIIRDQHAPRFGQDGVVVTGLASPSRGCATVSAWRVLLQPGAASPEHTLTSDEAFVALRGSARVELDGEAHELGAGDCLVVAPRRRVPHPQRRRASRSRPSAAWRRAGQAVVAGRVRSSRPGRPGAHPSQRAGACTRAGVPSATAPGGTSRVT